MNFTPIKVLYFSQTKQTLLCRFAVTDQVCEISFKFLNNLKNIEKYTK